MFASQRSVCVNDVDINVADVGTRSPTFVFLHYWGGSSRTWRPVMEGLCDTNRCVAIDFRGWGRSSKEARDYDLATLAADVVGVIADLGLTEFILVGHSMGGKVAQLVAAQRPIGLKTLILIAPAPPTPLGVPREQREGMITSYQTRAGVQIAIGVLSQLPLSDPHREQVIEDTLGGSQDAKRAWPERGMTEDISEAVSKIAVPVCIVVGSADNVESEHSLRAVFRKSIPSARFVVLPGVGHLAPLEAAADLVAAIRTAQVA